MITKLKVNVCSLAAESRQIRKEVERFKRDSPQKGADPSCQELIHHRRWDLRNEARAAQLLYGFVRGRPYRLLEQRSDWDDWKWHDAKRRLKAKARKFDVEWAEIEKWLSAIEAGSLAVG